MTSFADLRAVPGHAAEVEVFIPELRKDDLSPFISRVIFKGFINNGYAVRIQIKNSNFAILSSLFDGNRDLRLLEKFRKEPVEVKFKYKYVPPNEDKYPKRETREVTAYISMMYPHGSGNQDMIEIIAIDPVNYALRVSDAAGNAYEGKIYEAIEQLFDDYAPNIQYDIAQTNDSKSNVWWKMRRTPRDMLSHLMYFASSINQKKTPWILGIENDMAKLAPLTDFESKTLGYYRKMDEKGYGDIESWEAILNPSMGHYEMGLVTAGVTASLGQIYDQTNLPDKAIITDKNTGDKYVPKQKQTGILRSTIRPEEETFSAGNFGRDFVEAPPEYYSAGEIGLDFTEYFDCYARTKYMRDIYKLFTIDLKIRGHGQWDSTMNLGASTVYLDWTTNFKDGKKSYFLAGNWLVYGFEHYWYEREWTTTLMLAKLDINAKGQKVGL